MEKINEIEKARIFDSFYQYLCGDEKREDDRKKVEAELEKIMEELKSNPHLINEISVEASEEHSQIADQHKDNTFIKELDTKLQAKFISGVTIDLENNCYTIDNTNLINYIKNWPTQYEKYTNQLNGNCEKKDVDIHLKLIETINAQERTPKYKEWLEKNGNITANNEVSATDTNGNTPPPQIAKKEEKESDIKANTQFGLKDFEHEQEVLRDRNTAQLRLQSKGEYNNLIRANIKPIVIPNKEPIKIQKLFETWDERKGFFNKFVNSSVIISQNINKAILTTLNQNKIGLNAIKVLKITVDGWYVNDVQLSPESDYNLGINNNLAWNWNYDVFQKAKNLEVLIMDESSYIKFKEDIEESHNKNESEFKNALNYLFDRFKFLDYIEIQPNQPITRALWKNEKEEKELQDQIRQYDEKLATIAYAKSMRIGLQNTNPNNNDVPLTYGQMLGYMLIDKLCNFIGGGYNRMGRGYGSRDMSMRGGYGGMMTGLLGGTRSRGYGRYNSARRSRSRMGRRRFF